MERILRQLNREGSTSELFPITRCDRDRDSARDRLRESDALCA